MQQNPFEGSFKLRRLGDDEFKIEQGSEYDVIGEGAKFDFDRGKVASVTFGPNPIQVVQEGKLWKQKQFSHATNWTA